MAIKQFAENVVYPSENFVYPSEGRRRHGRGWERRDENSQAKALWGTSIIQHNDKEDKLGLPLLEASIEDLFFFFCFGQSIEDLFKIFS